MNDSENSSQTGRSRKKRKRRLWIYLPLFLLLFVLLAAGSYVIHLLNKIEKVSPSQETLDPATASFETDAPPVTSEGETMPEWARKYLEDETDSSTEKSGEDQTEAETQPGSSAVGTEPEGPEGSTEETIPITTQPPTTAFDYGNIQFIDCSGFINIVLVGQDERESEGRQRSDALLLLSINPKTKKASLISLMRDLYVDIPGYGKTRLNHAYWYGGFPLLYDTLEKDFCITVDGGFEVDFESFPVIVNILGGVDVEFTKDVAAAVFEDETKTGLQHVNGEQALGYVRFRAYGADFYRTARQRNLLTAVFNKVKGSGAGTLMDLLEQVLPYMRTDMSNGEILSLATKLAPMMGSLNLKSYSIPSNGDYYGAYRDGMSVLVPNLPAIKYHLLHSYLPY